MTFGMNRGTSEGADFLQRWHCRHPGATTTIGTLSDELGRNSCEVLAHALGEQDWPVLDLACGDAYLLELVRGDHECLGVDWNVAELRAAWRRLGHDASCPPLARADAADLPIPNRSLGAVLCHYALMLLQPLEMVLAELARILRRGGLLAAVLPRTSPDALPNPIGVFRAAWMQVSQTHPVTIPPIEDERTLQIESLRELLVHASFTSVVVQPILTSTAMAVEELTKFFLLTYMPDLLPPAGLADLTRILEIELDRLKDRTGKIGMVTHADVVTARRG
jgi:ubiquinone/menaquinone biosynthesis C-methylase UbiE